MAYNTFSRPRTLLPGGSFSAVAEESNDHLDRMAGGLKHRVLSALFSFEGASLAPYADASCVLRPGSSRFSKDP
jgi:hypothetical protein